MLVLVIDELVLLMNATYTSRCEYQSSYPRVVRRRHLVLRSVAEHRTDGDHECGQDSFNRGGCQDTNNVLHCTGSIMNDLFREELTRAHKLHERENVLGEHREFRCRGEDEAVRDRPVEEW